MKSSTTAMNNHLAQEVTTLCTCWKIVRQDGVVFGFTDHDRDLQIDDQLYECEWGYNRTALTTDSGMGVANVDVTGILSSDRITEEDLRNGLFDRANVYVFMVNWANPNGGIIRLRRGWFGEVVLNQNGMFSVELRGLAQALTHNSLEVYSPECRTDLFSPRCKLLRENFVQSGVVSSIQSRTVFTGTGPVKPSQGFLGGAITFTSGDNEGRTIEIIAEDGLQFTLFEGPNYPISVGDEFEIVPGCDKLLSTCSGVYNNVKNFRGEPDVPGQDEYMRYPDAH